MTVRNVGLVSGMDVENIVKSMVQPYQDRYDKEYKNKTTAEWKKDEYKTIYTKEAEFRAKMTEYKLSATVSPVNSNTSNKEVVTAKANSDALNVPHTLKVKQLAKAASVGSSEKMASAENKTTLKTQFANATDVSLSSEFSITVNGKEIKVDPTASLNQLLSNINSAGAGVKTTYDVTMDRVFLISEKTGSEGVIDFTGTSDAGMKFLTNALKMNYNYQDSSSEKLGSGTKTTLLTQFAGKDVLPEFTGDSKTFKISINGKEITLDASKNMQNMLSTINGSDAGVTASYDEVADTFMIVGKDGKKVDFTGTDAAGLKFLKQGLKLGTDGGDKLPARTQGQNSIFDLDGVTDLEQASNSFSIAGITYNLTGLGEANVTVEQDVDKIVANMKSFVELYNSLLTYTTDKANETKYRTYKPLTEDEESKLSETQAEKWEKLAKSGLLKNDDILTGLTSSMRNIMITSIEGIDGKYKNAAAIGISTGSNWKEGGKLYLDEDKLKTALAEDPTAVAKIFSGTGDKKEGRAGVAAKLYDLMTSSMEKIDDKAGVLQYSSTEVTSVLGKQINSYKNKMTLLEKQISTKEDYYYKQYAQMEKALQKIQNQTSSLFGGASS